MPPFKAVSYASLHPGRKLIVLGAVHGNETCGTVAIQRVMEEVDSGALQLCAGQVTFVPITNPLAYANRRRTGDRNLNRRLSPTEAPGEFEDHVANWLCPLLAAHHVLLDLHSFHSPGEPFVMVGPLDNAGELEPFSHAAEEEALARRVGVSRAVDGWLDTYAAGVKRRQTSAASLKGSSLDLDPRYGIGTTEYMRTVGGWGLTLECGQHDDPQAPAVAYRAIHRTLAHLGLVAERDPEPELKMQGLHLFDVVDKEDAADTFVRVWQSFEPVKAGELIGTRRHGAEVRSPVEGRIVFPNPGAEAGQEWFYLARPTDRF